MVSFDRAATTLNSLGVSLMPSKWKHSISHKVESLISLLFSFKWVKWLSYSHGIGTTSSLKHIGVGSGSTTPCASFGEGKIPCSPFLTLSPSRLDAIRWASSLSSMVEGKIPCSTVCRHLVVVVEVGSCYPTWRSRGVHFPHSRGRGSQV